MNTLYFLSGLSAFIALIAIIFAAHHQIEETKWDVYKRQTYNSASPALQNELKRIDNISGSALSPDTINLAFADTSTDAYDLRAFAIYLSLIHI